MLFARRQRKHETALTIGIDRLTAETARHVAQVLFLGREQTDIGTAERQGHADRLAFDGDDVGAHFTRRFEQAQRHDFGNDDDQKSACGLRGCGDLRQVCGRAKHIRCLHDDTGRIGVDVRQHVGFVVDGQGAGFGFDADGVRKGLDRFAIMRMQAARQDRLVALGHTRRHQHAFSGCRRAVVKRGIGHRHAGQARHLRLELEQDLEGPLRDFRLVRRITGQEFRPLDDVIDRRRNMVPISPCPDKERRLGWADVLGGEGLQLRLHFQLAGIGRQIDSAGTPGRRRHIDKQFIDGFDADGIQHGHPVGLAQGQITHENLLQGIEISFVGGAVHKAVEFRRVRQLDLGNPAGAFGRGIDGVRAVGQFGIGVQNFARDRRIDVRSRLDAFDHGEAVALFKLLAHVRDFDKNDVAKRIGGVGGDADQGRIARNLDPLVILGEFHDVAP